MQSKTKIVDVLTGLIVKRCFPILAIVIIFFTTPDWEPRANWGILFAYTIITVICTFAPVRTLNATLTINNAVIFTGIILEGTWIAIWCGLIEVLILAFLFKSSITRSLANAGQMLITIWIVGTLQAWLTSVSVPWVITDMLLIPVYWGINTLLCAMLVSHYENVPWNKVVDMMVKVGTPTYLMFMVIGAIGGRVIDAYGNIAIIPLAAAFAAINMVFRQYFDSHNKLEEKIEEINSINHSFLTALATSIDARDPYTSGHSQRVAFWGREIANAIGLPKHQVDKVYFGGILHDVGKIGIEDHILNKDGRLSAEEFERIKRHTVIGYEIVKQAGVFEDLLPAVRSHHERIDGSGYPDKLKGEEIPLIARILAIADSFDAMVSDRPYRSGMPIDNALQQIEEGIGKQYDERLALEFLQLIKKIPNEELLQIIGKHNDNQKWEERKEAIQ